MKAVSIEHLSKQYQLGVYGTGLLYRDLQAWWARQRGKENPNSKVLKKQQSSGKVWALQDVSFDITEGEVVGIIGKNGAGKSTLLKILSRVTAPTTGVVRTRGRLASLLEVGTGFHSELTGRENTYLNGAILGMTRREITSVLDEIVEFAGLGPYLDTPVKRYSSGMYVRLAFAVAAHLRSDIMIVDEVLAVGDIEFQKKCIGKMQGVSRESGKTVLFVSHNMETVESLCTRGVVLREGCVVFDGATKAAIEEYTGVLERLTQQEGAHRTDRWGDGNAMLTRTRARVELSPTGEATITIGLDIRVLRSDIISFLHCILEIRTARGGNITFVASEAVDFTVQPDSTHIHLKCVISDAPLNAGTYHYDVWIKNGKTVEDMMAHAGTFTVPPRDYYGNGRTPPENHPLLLRHTWSRLQTEPIHDNGVAK